MFWVSKLNTSLAKVVHQKKVRRILKKQRHEQATRDITRITEMHIFVRGPQRNQNKINRKKREGETEGE